MNRFTAKQWQYIAARLVSKSDAEAAKRIGLKPQSVAAWDNKLLINEYIETQRESAADGVATSLQSYALQASARLAELMASQDEAIALRASLAIIDHTIGKPTQKLSAAMGQPDRVQIRFIDYGLSVRDDEE